MSRISYTQPSKLVSYTFLCMVGNTIHSTFFFHGVYVYNDLAWTRGLPFCTWFFSFFLKKPLLLTPTKRGGVSPPLWPVASQRLDPLEFLGAILYEGFIQTSRRVLGLGMSEASTALPQKALRLKADAARKTLGWRFFTGRILKHMGGATLTYAVLYQY